MKSNVRNFIILLVLCFILLIVPYLYRLEFANGSLIGDSPYYFLRLAESKEFIYDNLSFGGKFVVLELGWPFLLSLSPLFLSWFLPVALGLFSFILFYFIFGKFENENLRSLSTLLLIMSPLFIYFFTISNNYAPAIFLTLLGIYLFLEKRYIFTSICFGIISLFSVPLFIINTFLLLTFILFKERELFRYFLINLIIGLIFIVLQFWRVYWFGMHFSLNYNLSLFTDFGAQYGIGFFILILALFGVYYKKHYFMYLLLLLGFILSGYFQILVVYLNFILVIYAAISLLEFWKLKWTSDLLKKITFLVLICCLMFTTVAYVNEYVRYYPNESTLEGMRFLKNKEGIVFSDVSRGHWITYSGTKSFIDGNYYFFPDYEQRKQDYDQILFSKNYEEFVNLIKKYNIKYFWIDKAMRDRLYGGDNEGMAFWLRYGNDFELAYKNPELQIWEFKQK